MNRDPLAIIESANVGAADAALETLAEGTVPADLDNLADGVVSGTALIDFANAPNLDIRASVSLALLFASRVADQAKKEDDTEDDWLATYTKTLSSIGFGVTGYSVVTSKFRKTGVSLHKAIIPFLTIAFGGAAVGPVILAGLKNLQEMDSSSSWISLFDRSTRRFNAREMHFAAVNSGMTQSVIHYAVARLNVDTDETKALFLRITKANAEFESATTTMSANNALLSAMEPKLRAKLVHLVQSTIANADVG